MLIHDRDPRPSGENLSPWEPNWRIWCWVLAAAIVGFAAANASGGLSILLVITTFGLCCRAVDEAIPYGDGLREWRQ